MIIYQELYHVQSWKMTIRATSYNNLISLESELKELKNTSFKFYDLGDLHRRLNSQPIHPITQNL